MSARRDRLRRGRRHGGPAKALIIILAVLVTAGLAAGIAGAGYVYSIASDAPSISDLKPLAKGESSVVYAADGTKLGTIESDIQRTPVASTAIPQAMRDATVAVEDRRFYEHGGIDVEGILRAAVKNVEEGETVEGGSTLTMQLVRNLYISNEKTWKRKIREAKLAEQLENIHTGEQGKLWVLTKYLNVVPYGTTNGTTAVGVEAASRMFFDKPAKDLTLDQAALIAGLPQAPSQYNPFYAPKAARARRNDVLQRMAKQKMITQAAMRKAQARPLGVHPGNRFYTQRRESFFFDYVKQELINRYGVEEVRQGGLKVRTTIDLKLQQAARAAIRDTLTFANPPSSAIVTIDPANGYIRAMASSADYGRSKFNLAAQGHRQPGSTFKVMGLMAALDAGVSPSTQYTSRPLNFVDPKYGPIKVKTYSNSYKGRISLLSATLSSDNSVYQQLALDVGPDKVKKAAREMGIKSKLNAYPSEVLGGLEDGVSPLEMANAYATIASGGWRNRPKAITRVTFADGRVSNWGKPARARAFRDGVTYEATKILEQNMKSGTGVGAQIGCPAGGKTGTTDNNTDAWFVGFTPNLSTAVWVGFPGQRVPMNPPTTPISVAGGTYPATIWQKYMKVAKKGCGDFTKPKQPFQTKPFKGKYQQVQPEPKDQAQADGADKKKDTDKKQDGNGNGNGGGPDNGGAAPQGGAQPAQPQPPAAQPQPAQPTPAQPAQPAPQAPAQGGAPVDPAQYVAPG
jgi:penicillin-binding protein 1A